METKDNLPNNDPITLLATEDLNLVEVEFSEENFLDWEQASSKESGTRNSNRAKTDDTVGAFFKEMARYPLLTAQEEVELAQAVQFIVTAEATRKKITGTATASAN